MAKAKKPVTSAKKNKLQVIKNSGNDITVRTSIEKLSKDRQDAALIWKTIKGDKRSDVEIKSLINSKNFFVLLGKIA